MKYSGIKEKMKMKMKKRNYKEIEINDD